jgi:hypothetical protein
MAEDLQEYLKLLIPTVDGLEAIIVTDKDGVPVAKGLKILLAVLFILDLCMVYVSCSKYDVSTTTRIETRFFEYICLSN